MFIRKRVFILLVLFLPLFAISQQRWEVIISNSGLDFELITSDCAYDEGFITNARIKTVNNRNYFMKSNINGELLWDKVIVYNNNWTNISRIKQNQNGETLFCGTVDGYASLLLLDACGNPSWCNEFISSEYYTETIHMDAFFLDNGDIITLTSLYKYGSGYDVGLMSFDNNGDFLWFHPYGLLEKYNLLDMVVPYFLDYFNNFFIISGFCYYAYPDNPSLVYLKPMFIKTDNNFDEEWFLPYGMGDTIIGDATGVISFDGNVFNGYGAYKKLGAGFYNSILMNFNIDGNESSYIGIDNSAINDSVTENMLFRVVQRDDTSYIASAKFGNAGYENPFGEWIMDTLGNIFQYQSHENAGGNITPIIKTTDDKYCFAYQYNYSDILLYKLNADLSQAEIDTNSYNYDSLCDDLPIVSDTIYLDNCSIVTSIDEAPTPSEYYASLKTINIIVMPNPANNAITFEVESSGYHNNIVLTCYNVSGQKIFEKYVEQNQATVKTSITNWQSGIYVVVASSENGGYGNSKFVVK